MKPVPLKASGVVLNYNNKIMKISKIIFGILIMTVLPFMAKAQDYRIHSVFIYNFTKYIQWPSNEQNGDFIIGVLGSSPMVESLEKLASERKIGNRSMVVKKFASIDQLSKCHMLFIPDRSSNDLEAALAKISGQSTLIMTERKGLGTKGSGINFITVDGKQKFELNKAATEKAQLKVSTELTSLAIVI